MFSHFTRFTQPHFALREGQGCQREYNLSEKKILFLDSFGEFTVHRVIFFPPILNCQSKKFKIKKSIELRLNLTWKSTLLSERVYFVLLVIMGNDMSLPLADFASWLPCQQPQGRVLILIDGDTHCVDTSFPDPHFVGVGQNLDILCTST